MFQKLLEKMALAIDEAAIPYMIIGGQAVLVYGEPRLTKDIDITLGIDVSELDKIIALSKKCQLTPLVENISEFVRQTYVFPVREEQSGIRIDFIFSTSPYERQAIQRAIPKTIGTISIQFASLEDVVIHKIIAGRARDLEDVQSILVKNPNYDQDYIFSWLQQFEQALDQDFSQSFRQITQRVMEL